MRTCPVFPTVFLSDLLSQPLSRVLLTPVLIDAHRLGSGSFSVANERPFQPAGAAAHCSSVLVARDTSTPSAHSKSESLLSGPFLNHPSPLGIEFHKWKRRARAERSHLQKRFLCRSRRQKTRFQAFGLLFITQRLLNQQNIHTYIHFFLILEFYC